MLKHEQELNRLADALYRPVNNIPDRLYNSGIPELSSGSMRATSIARVPIKSPTAGVGLSGAIGVLLDLLTYSGDTNSNESAELSNRQSAPATNRPEYEALLNQVLNSGNATFPTK